VNADGGPGSERYRLNSFPTILTKARYRRAGGGGACGWPLDSGKVLSGKVI